MPARCFASPCSSTGELQRSRAGSRRDCRDRAASWRISPSPRTFRPTRGPTAPRCRQTAATRPQPRRRSHAALSSCPTDRSPSGLASAPQKSSRAPPGGRTGGAAVVLASPRGLSRGSPAVHHVTGLGGRWLGDLHDGSRPRRVLVSNAAQRRDLVLEPGMGARGGFIHVDVDPEIPGSRIQPRRRSEMLLTSVGSLALLNLPERATATIARFPARAPGVGPVLGGLCGPRMARSRRS
jgi:hypothetical protein